MAETKAKEKEGEVVLEQFRRNLDHILIKTDVLGPELTIGSTKLQFKASAPVSALASLIGDENRVEGMRKYLLGALVAGQEEAFTLLLDSIDIDGLGEILNVLGEAYTSFPAKS